MEEVEVGVDGGSPQTYFSMEAQASILWMQHPNSWLVFLDWIFQVIECYQNHRQGKFPMASYTNMIPVEAMGYVLG